MHFSGYIGFKSNNEYEEKAKNVLNTISNPEILSKMSDEEIDKFSKETAKLAKSPAFKKALLSETQKMIQETKKALLDLPAPTDDAKVAIVIKLNQLNNQEKELKLLTKNTIASNISFKGNPREIFGPKEYFSSEEHCLSKINDRLSQNELYEGRYISFLDRNSNALGLTKIEYEQDLIKRQTNITTPIIKHCYRNNVLDENIKNAKKCKDFYNSRIDITGDIIKTILNPLQNLRNNVEEEILIRSNPYNEGYDKRPDDSNYSAIISSRLKRFRIEEERERILTKEKNEIGDFVHQKVKETPLMSKAYDDYKKSCVDIYNAYIRKQKTVTIEIVNSLLVGIPTLAHDAPAIATSILTNDYFCLFMKTIKILGDIDPINDKLSSITTDKEEALNLSDLNFEQAIKRALIADDTLTLLKTKDETTGRPKLSVGQIRNALD